MRRTMPLAVHDAYTTRSMVQAGREKGGQQLAGLFTIQAVQVDFFLHHPATATQIAQHALGQPLAQVMRLIATFQPVLQADLAMQAFMQGGPFIGQMLQGAGWWRGLPRSTRFTAGSGLTPVMAA